MVEIAKQRQALRPARVAMRAQGCGDEETGVSWAQGVAGQDAVSRAGVARSALTARESHLA